MSDRFKGKLSNDIVYLSRSAYRKKKNFRIINKSKNLKILIAPHSFSDSPHCYGNNFFTDHFEWLEFLGQVSNLSNYDWYIKCHPDYTTYFDKTVDQVKNFTKKYPKINYLNSNVSHLQIIEEGINFVLTVNGSIASEYPYFDVCAINASKNNPHNQYDFSVTPSNKREYINIIKNLKLSKNRIIKKEILEYYFMRHEHYNNRWFFSDLNKVKKEIKDYKNFSNYLIYQYWLKNFNLKQHNIKYKKIKKFIDSNDYIFLDN